MALVHPEHLVAGLDAAEDADRVQFQQRGDHDRDDEVGAHVGCGGVRERS